MAAAARGRRALPGQGAAVQAEETRYIHSLSALIVHVLSEYFLAFSHRTSFSFDIFVFSRISAPCFCALHPDPYTRPVFDSHCPLRAHAGPAFYQSRGDTKKWDPNKLSDEASMCLEIHCSSLMKSTDAILFSFSPSTFVMSRARPLRISFVIVLNPAILYALIVASPALAAPGCTHSLYPGSWPALDHITIL